MSSNVDRIQWNSGEYFTAFIWIPMSFTILLQISIREVSEEFRNLEKHVFAYFGVYSVRNKRKTINIYKFSHKVEDLEILAV